MKPSAEVFASEQLAHHLERSVSDFATLSKVSKGNYGFLSALKDALTFSKKLGDIRTMMAISNAIRALDSNKQLSNPQRPAKQYSKKVRSYLTGITAKERSELRKQVAKAIESADGNIVNDFIGMVGNALYVIDGALEDGEIEFGVYDKIEFANEEKVALYKQYLEENLNGKGKIYNRKIGRSLRSPSNRGESGVETIRGNLLQDAQGESGDNVEGVSGEDGREGGGIKQYSKSLVEQEKPTFRSFQNASELIVATEAYLQNSLGKNVKLVYPKSYKQLQSQIVSKTNSVKTAKAQAKKLLSLLTDLSITDIDEQTHKRVALGKLGDILDPIGFQDLSKVLQKKRKAFQERKLNLFAIIVLCNTNPLRL